MKIDREAIERCTIADANARYYSYPMERLMERAGKGIAEAILAKYGTGKRVVFLCGPGNNGGDGSVAARHLKGRADTCVYLIGMPDDIRTREARRNWDRLKAGKLSGRKPEELDLKCDIIVECLFGTGIEGKLREPYLSVVNRLKSARAVKVSVDLPVPGYTPDLVLSLMEEKVRGALTIDIGYPEYLRSRIGVGEVQALRLPPADSHKGDNGRLLIVGGNERYHGAPLMATKVASRFVDLIYFASVPENNRLLRSLRSRSCELIAIPRTEIDNVASAVDTILIGPGLGRGRETAVLIEQLMKDHADRKFVIDADALHLVKKQWLHERCIVTPHRSEFKALFGVNPSREQVRKMARKHHCIVISKGKTDIVSDGAELKLNTTGNAGMTKGGTGDVLAGLVAALACTNDPYLSARVAVFVNGLAGDRLKKHASYYFSAMDLIHEIPHAMAWAQGF